MKDLATFRESLSETEPPKGLSLALKALWWDAKGDWNRAHEFAQQREDEAGNWVHAYLHRKEGDIWNAGYWYRRARKPEASGDLAAEWEQLVRYFLSNS